MFSKLEEIINQIEILEFEKDWLDQGRDDKRIEEINSNISDHHKYIRENIFNK